MRRKCDAICAQMSKVIPDKKEIVAPDVSFFLQSVVLAIAFILYGDNSGACLVSSVFFEALILLFFIIK